MLLYGNLLKKGSYTFNIRTSFVANNSLIGGGEFLEGWVVWGELCVFFPFA